MKIAVFAYDFPHVKCQDVLLNFIVKRIDITCVIGAPKIELELPKSIKRVKVKKEANLSAREICERFNIPYYVYAHNSKECENILKENKIDLGVIAGARILKENIINSVNIGILNVHPGLIPQVRGLDALKWAVYNDYDIGVTAHFIDSKVDAGKIIDKQTIKIEPDDTFFDLSEKIAALDIQVMLSTVRRIIDGNIQVKDAELIGKHNTVMENEKGQLLDDMLKKYLEKHVKN